MAPNFSLTDTFRRSIVPRLPFPVSIRTPKISNMGTITLRLVTSTAKITFSARKNVRNKKEIKSEILCIKDRITRKEVIII